MGNNVDIKYTSPDDVLEEDITIPRDTDLPITIQLYTGKVTYNSADPYDLNGHTITMEIFSDRNALEALVEFTDDDWDREESPDQSETAVNDIIKRVILWEELSVLETENSYWYRIIATDAASVSFQIVRGTFLKQGY